MREDAVRPHEPRAARPALIDGPVRVAGIAISHPHRILYSPQGVTKHELARYYEQVADVMLPHVAGRPLTLVRCPEGQGQACFYQRHAGPSRWVTANTPQALVTLVQMGVLEVHPWGARTEDLEHPDRLVMDLDPGEGVSWAQVVAGARTLKRMLAAHDLEAFVKTTGGRGLHVVVPLARGAHEWPEVHAYAHLLAARMSRGEPERYVAIPGKEHRVGKIFVDYLRNARSATAVAAYSSRARPGATVSMPVAWSALPKIDPEALTVRSVLTALARRRIDPWARIDRVQQRLTASMVTDLER